MTTQQQFGEQIHIESDCEQNASLLKKLKMWNLAPHIKKLDAGIFFFGLWNGQNTCANIMQWPA